MSVPDHLPDYYKTLSLKVYHVLEENGATTETRQLRMDVSTTREVLSQMAFQRNKKKKSSGVPMKGPQQQECNPMLIAFWFSTNSL